MVDTCEEDNRFLKLGEGVLLVQADVESFDWTLFVGFADFEFFGEEAWEITLEIVECAPELVRREVPVHVPLAHHLEYVVCVL